MGRKREERETIFDPWKKYRKGRPFSLLLRCDFLDLPLSLFLRQAVYMSRTGIMLEEMKRRETIRVSDLKLRDGIDREEEMKKGGLNPFNVSLLVMEERKLLFSRVDIGS